MARRFTKLSRPAIRSLKSNQAITEQGISFRREPSGDGVYSVNIMVDGQRVHRVIGRESEGVTRKQAEDYIEQIKTEIELTTSEYDQEKLEERLAKLVGGVAQINVGAATEIEMKEKKARVEDALHACRAAVEEGVMPGGGGCDAASGDWPPRGDPR